MPPDIYWSREWAEEAAPMLYRHKGLPYTRRIVAQRHDRTPAQYWLWLYRRGGHGSMNGNRPGHGCVLILIMNLAVAHPTRNQGAP